MTISRITTWVDGQVLTAAALNGEFDNLINNPVTLVFPLPAGSGAIDFNYNPVNKFVVGQNTNTTVEGGLSAAIGTGLLVYNDGSTRSRLMGPSAGLSRVRGLTGSLISNIASFQADGGYQLQRSITGGNVGNELLTNVSCTSSFSIDTQTPGPIAGGRDQAAAFASTDIHFYAIAGGSASTTIFGVCSSVPPPYPSTGIAATLYWAYLGSAKYNVAASAVTQSWLVRGSRISPSASLQIAAVAFSTAQVTVPLATYVPSVATQFEVMSLLRYQSSVGATSLLAGAKIGTSTGTAGLVYDTEVAVDQTVPLSGTLSHNAPLTLPVRSTGPQLYWLANPTTTSQAVGVGFNLLSYTVPNGDN